jgi:hypothetical protein
VSSQSRPRWFGDGQGYLPAKLAGFLFGRHQAFPGTAQTKLNSKRGREEQIDLTGFDLLEVPSSNFGALGQFFLCQPFEQALAANVRAECPDSLPLFSAQRHGLLHRALPGTLNDVYIVKYFLCLRSLKGTFRVRRS